MDDMKNNARYKAIARQLDGADARLEADDKALADEIAEGEAWLARALDAPTPQAVLDRVAGRVERELAAQRRSHWLRRSVAATAAMAAAVVLALTLLHGPSQPPGTPAPGPAMARLSPLEASEAFLAAPEAHAGLEWFAAELDEMFAEVSTPSRSSLDLRLDAMDNDLNDPWMLLDPLLDM